ncbi:BTAD domain-containing putative transcriptional regulator [Sphaerisporangium sp. TRM90804]|uniref:AfsR/SARP family transcriptional regulator n=1 Tax=Sphaerisporangium sp. TRM90804 TaxID=3031113 RepID=UPI00244C4427|nr:BTAD domain-containing putative transcriptional regulator [Sphaerisporangium sp. TRM90804]
MANLLLDANRVVTVDRLIDAIYGEVLPPTSKAQVQICISALRRLFAANGEPAIISTHPRGYIMRVDDEQLDARRFEALTTQARRDRDAGHIEDAVKQYREALALWRGEALEGIDSRPVRAAASRLAEDRITTNEDCLQLELDLGRHYELVGELTALVAEHPLRERLCGQLMLALYRSGRQAEALRVYRFARETLVEELGIEPNEQLQRLEYSILTSDESLNSPVRQTAGTVGAAAEPAAPPPPPVPARPVPILLPAAVADFTGRGKQLDAIQRELSLAAEDPYRFAVPIIVIAGKGGLGKTTLAVHSAHSVAERFPDGQLFADLHGGAGRQISPMQVLERFLRALGVPGPEMPDGLEERAEMYRAMLADRKTLIVLDDAATEGQVLPLLPGNRMSAVIITSRSRLAGLPGAIQVEMDIFDTDQSMEMLSRIAGTERMHAEAEAAQALADLCGRLPLALRIAGARLSARPHWSVEQLVSRLEDETRRLDELKHGDMGIRASISLTYESVGEEAKRLFRLLAVLDSSVFSGWVGAALLDRPYHDARDLLDDLADAQLIETVGGYGPHTQYRFHDLIRVFARERLATEATPEERRAALERVLGALLYLAEAARRRVYGDANVLTHGDAARWPLQDKLVDQLTSAALDWFERERGLLVSGIRQAAQAGFTDLCWDLAVTAMFETRGYLDDWRETNKIALAATRQAGNIRGQAALLNSRGGLHITLKRIPEARRDLEEAIELFNQCGDGRGTGLIHGHMAFLDRITGDYEGAIAHYEHALEMFSRMEDHASSAYVLHNLAQVRLEADDPEGASRLLSEALTLSRRGGNKRVEAQVLYRLGETYLNWREPALAVESFEKAIEITREIGDPIGEAYVLGGMGLARLRLGETGAAEEALRQAVHLAVKIGDRLAEGRSLLGLGEVAMARGEHDHAVNHFLQAIGVFQTMGATPNEARARALLAEAQEKADGLIGAARIR